MLRSIKIALSLTLIAINCLGGSDQPHQKKPRYSRSTVSEGHAHAHTPSQLKFINEDPSNMEVSCSDTSSESVIASDDCSGYSFYSSDYDEGEICNENQVTPNSPSCSRLITTENTPEQEMLLTGKYQTNLKAQLEKHNSQQLQTIPSDTDFLEKWLENIQLEPQAIVK